MAQSRSRGRETSKRVCMQINPKIGLHAELLNKLEELKELAAAGSTGEVALRILLRFIDQAFQDPAINLTIKPTQAQSAYRAIEPDTTDEFDFTPTPVRATSNGSGKRRGPLTLDN